MRRFAMPWDRALRISTVIVVLLLIAIGGGVAWVILAIPGGAPSAAAFAAFPPAVILATLLFLWLLAPRQIAVGGGRLLLDRRLRPIAIPLAEIIEVEVMGPGPLRGALRAMGASGAFGHYGRYWSRTLGGFRLFATRSDRLVRIDTPVERFLLSPEPVEGFVEALLAQAPRAVRATGCAARPGGGALRALWPIGAALALLVLAVGGILGGSWAFAPRAIYARDGAVVIERNLAGDVTLAIEPPVRVRRVAPDELGRVWRTGGVAMGDIRYGRWRSSALGPFQLYSYRWGPLFLIDGPDGRVVVVPDDPKGFAEAVGAEP